MAERTCERLEAALDDMMVVLAIEIFDVQRQAGILREGLEPFLEQLGIHKGKPRVVRQRNDALLKQLKVTLNLLLIAAKA